MTQTEHLQLIRTRCLELLENHRDNGIDKYTEPAEAGWLATKRTVETLLVIIQFHTERPTSETQIAELETACDIADIFCSAWPIELLNNK